MKKLLWLLAVTICFANGIKANSEKEIYKSGTLSIYRISDHLYRHVSYLSTKSFGNVACNGMIVTNQNEAVVFDTPTTDSASRELIDWLTNTLNNKITAVIPTHFHDDNLGGLNEFHKREIPSYAYQKTIAIAEENGLPRPQNAFDKYLELKIGDEIVITEFFGEGHTSDNVIGYFPMESCMFGGCLIKAAGADKGNLEEANPQAWSETVRKVRSKYPEINKIIPGHGEPGGVELLEYTIRLFE